MGGGRELGHVEPDLGDEDLRGAADAGDLVEPSDDRERRRPSVPPLALVGACEPGSASISSSMRPVSVSIFPESPSISSSSIRASSA